MVSIICCTMRPSFMNNIFSNYERQNFENKELIIVLNRDDMDIDQWREAAKEHKHVSVYKISENSKLGKCLNYGIGQSTYDLIAKFDDDDYYASDYLKEGVSTLKRTGASVVGKHTSFVYFEEKKALMLFRKGGEEKYRRHLKGGTLLFKRSVWDQIKFNEEMERASDAEFLRRCKRSGNRLYSSSRYNYVCNRRKNIDSHTQKTSTEEYMAKCQFISYTDNYISIITKNFHL
ncbi:glycosyltransferase [Paenibacillus sp. NPDC058910]|uniref:glycosyltransferase n=1 Tax=unclassified Paenibacillus TaxID=185978 RepID=UPI0036C08554